MKANTKSKFGYQTSAGGVIVKKIQGIWKTAILLREAGKVWALPKGLIEKNETYETTALREVAEETGLTGEILAPLGSVQYGYYSKWDNTRYHKTVHFFLMRARSGSVKNHDFEALEVRWFPLENAISHLTFPAEKKITQTAHRMLAEQNDGRGEALGTFRRRAGMVSRSKSIPVKNARRGTSEEEEE